ncbi:glycine oxidase ThiO (plasmid) [Rhizobium leguminosarum]|jgi:glycine oxidase|uniref:glycine oxidase ThiO n=1 Tax=Rhizobium leguminosarum TaxID=384 RepID=UPI00103912C3|nr:glycine oxidase ThiO [Rhizobium leguminosarum]MBY5919934.1 glycine oxidase ThiO [Rhizobium leguminosarum]TBY19886.1 glycine oxidase ThiO [Rhizobium leguminosarum bv. viciae]TBZ61150.1 glycine oxidase ThiO [Rhizobium leguminosarum bv. viciae]TCA95121.1 glycine oxidase ThiO [Rhizobium leguminosarum bv. viciae]
MSTFLVKGAGVAGLAMAHELVRRGFSVEVIEKAGAAGLGASHFAGGMLAPYCEREAAEEIVLTLGLGAAGWWEEAVPGEVRRRGTLVVAQPRDLPDLVRFAARTTGHVWIDRKGVTDLEPALAGRFEKALFFQQEAHLDPRRALARLAGRLRERGVVFHFGGHEPQDRRFAGVLDCTGPAAIPRLSGMRGVRGEMLYLETADVTLSRPIRMLHPRHPIYIVPRDDHRFMVGATMIEAEDDGPITARSLMEFLNAAYTLHPAFGEARVVETGTGIRPAFANNIPQVIETEEGLAIAGMHRHGFLLAPAMAVRAADILLARHSRLKG